MPDDPPNSVVLEINAGNADITYISAVSPTNHLKFAHTYEAMTLQYLADAYDYELRPSGNRDPSEDGVSAGLYWDGHGGIIQNRMHGYPSSETDGPAIASTHAPTTAPAPASAHDPAHTPVAPNSMASVSRLPLHASARAADPPDVHALDHAASRNSTRTGAPTTVRAADPNLIPSADSAPPTAGVVRPATGCGTTAAAHSSPSPSGHQWHRPGPHTAYCALPEDTQQQSGRPRWQHKQPAPPPHFTPDQTSARVVGHSLSTYERNLHVNTGPFDETGIRREKYLYTISVAIFAKEGSSQVHSGGWEVVFYELIIDTAGLSDCWVFGNVPWEQFSTVVTVLPADEESTHRAQEELKRAYLSKRKMIWPKDGPDTLLATLSYGKNKGGSRGVNVKQTVCALQFAKWVPVQRRLADFALGVVYAADASLVLNAHDGLLALGRGENPGSRMSPNSPYAEFCKPLAKHLYDQGLIKTQDFWMTIHHATWDCKQQDYLCFGAYVNKRPHTDYRWQDILVDEDSKDAMPGFWGLQIERIRLFKGSEDRMNIGFKKLVYAVVDSGASMSFLPSEFTRPLQLYLRDHYGAPESHASYDIEDDLMVEFTFRSGSHTVKVVGQALRFLISPLRVDNREGNPGCDVKEHARAILGLNFFRTFAVGFKDGEEPKVSLARHPDVDRRLREHHFQSAVLPSENPLQWPGSSATQLAHQAAQQSALPGPAFPVISTAVEPAAYQGAHAGTSPAYVDSRYHQHPLGAPQDHQLPPPTLATHSAVYVDPRGVQPTYAHGHEHVLPPGQQYPVPNTIPPPAVAQTQAPRQAYTQVPPYPAQLAFPQGQTPYGQDYPQASHAGPVPHAYPPAGYAQAPQMPGQPLAAPPAHPQAQAPFPHAYYGEGQQSVPAHAPPQGMEPANPRPRRKSTIARIGKIFGLK
ncbi:hypothetical protein AURDEDRAFT_188023 [Auricularia subglabra TFB-10046 SS5]|uniref:Peptidase A1 domain-containing protein n=1 Tax=Auricularia subglabra (strain TFB-10046 / SS5) TaxID=717982 RepID=J0LHN7_AURST|nr:hypothetical protein AURDEDRAFT_188023 [Auricularia subglabra TFB-10046 SS5]